MMGAGQRPLDDSLIGGLPGHGSVLITGGTGLIGRRLIAVLRAGGHDLTVLTRDAAQARRMTGGDGLRFVTDLRDVDAEGSLDAIVNLAGEPIADGLWTKTKRQRIVESRISVTRQVVDLIARLDRKPVLVSGSAIGWYGLRGDEPLTETSAGTPCFSHELCAAWEDEAMQAEAQGARIVLLRTGLVLDPDGGMLARLLPTFRLGLGGKFGDGRHWMSWIHRDDLVGLILHAIAGPEVAGPLNGTAPQPVTNRDFVRALATALHRPTLLPVPAWPLETVLGDFAKELLFSGQRVLPEAALNSGYAFRHPALAGALGNLLAAS